MSEEKQTTETETNPQEEQDDQELRELKQKIEAMQKEAEAINKMQEAPASKAKPAPKGDKKDVDQRSIYVGNVDYASTPEELQEHFSSCGTINRITILCDKYTGHPKGFGKNIFYKIFL